MIELMIVVAIVAILAAVAYPSYAAYIQRGRIAEATSQLAMVRVRLEQYYQDNRSYGSTAAGCGVAMPTAPYFDITCGQGATAGQTFVITATGTTGSSMAGFTYTINDANTQQTTAFPDMSSGLPADCWIQRKGQSC